MSIRVERKGGSSVVSGAMTDISFLLIIFFLVAASFIADTGIALLLPEEDTQPELVEEEKLILVHLPLEGPVLINHQEVLADQFVDTASRAAAGLEKPIALIQVDKEVVYQDVLDLLADLKKAGCSRFSIYSDDIDAVPLEIQ